MSTRLTNGVYTFTDGESDWGTLMNSNLQLLDNLVGNHGSTVSFLQTLTSGVKIGKITINGTEIELYHTDYSGKADATSVYTKTEVDDFLEEKADALDLTSHTDDDDIHVTALEKESWTAKQDALTDEQLENIDSISDLDEKYISADDTTIVKLTNLNEINLQEDHYNAWIGYRGGEVTNWKFGNGSEGGYADVYANDFYINDESLSDKLDSLGYVSLPNYSQKVAVDTTSWHAGDNVYVAPYDCWFALRLTVGGFAIRTNGAQITQNNSVSYSTEMMPLKKDDQIIITLSENFTILACDIFSCVGNV